jgi:endoglucanase
MSSASPSAPPGSDSKKHSLVRNGVVFSSLTMAVALHCAMAAPPGTLTLRIAVDQFGYLPDMTKMAVISDPQAGFNGGANYTPGGALQVRTWDSNTVVLSGSPSARISGGTDPQSGDRNWWFDFSAVTRWEQYYVYDPANDARSARFRIGPDVYEEVMKHAMRVYYYQHRGAAKSLPCADARWTDATNFLGPLQDSHCRLITNPILATEKDLRGGWFADLLLGWPGQLRQHPE